MLAFLEPLEELADYQEIVRKRGKAEGILQIAGCVSSQKTHLMYALGDGFEYRVIVFPVRKKQSRRMKNTKCWRRIPFCILQRIFYFIMRISRVLP